MAPSELAKQARRDAEGGSVAAELRSVHAQFTLGRWHEEGGEGLEQDYVKAAALFHEAADLGHEGAQNHLAACYYKGQGVEQNFARAAEWEFNISKSLGNTFFSLRAERECKLLAASERRD